MIFGWSLSVLDAFGCVAEGDQCVKIFILFRNSGKVLNHLRILKMECLKYDSELVTLTSQISFTNQSLIPHKCSVYKLLYLPIAILVSCKLDMVFHYIAF